MTTADVTAEALDAVFTGILTNARDELQAIVDPTELEQFWFFRYDPAHSTAVNLYQFHSMLSLYQRKCRQWEEIHNGSSCVVERVRDQYLMPKIREFLANLNG